MKEDGMLMCLIAFGLGYLVSRMMRGNGLSVGVLHHSKRSKEDCEESIQEIRRQGGSCGDGGQYSCQEILPDFWSTSCSPVNH